MNALVKVEGTASDAPDDDAQAEAHTEDAGRSDARHPSWSIPHELPSPNEPMKVARQFSAENFTDNAVLTLRYWRGGWWRWRGSHWIELETQTIQSAAWRYTEHAVYEVVTPFGAKLAPWTPNRYRVTNLLEAMKAVCHLDSNLDQPTWLTSAPPVQGRIVACANGLLHLDDRSLLPHTPRYFNLTAVPFDYDANAPQPNRWLHFLQAVWPDAADNAQALQEFFGYVISGRLDLQKILLWIGPTRGGKGLSARLLGKLIGPANVAGPTLDSLSTDFGLAPLIGKSLAFISDARLSGRNRSAVVERLLNISGEDTVTVNRKYRDQWTGKLPARFFVISNEVPEFGDASAAIVGRFIILQSTPSWLGREDPALEDDLENVLPGVLNWALAGLTRLEQQGRFTRPRGMDEIIVTMTDLASPVAAFLRSACQEGGEVAVDALYAAWKTWAADNGQRAMNKQVFGKNLRAAKPLVRIERPRDDSGEQVRVYVGISLKPVVASGINNGESRVSRDSNDSPSSTHAQNTAPGRDSTEQLRRAETRLNPLFISLSDINGTPGVCALCHRKPAVPGSDLCVECEP